MRYLYLVYHEEAATDALPADEYAALARATTEHREDLRQRGHDIISSFLQPSHTATTIRVRNGRLSITDGPVTAAKEQIGGFYLIDARDLNDAIREAAKLPQARVGSVEVRPLKEGESL